jgi:hypothetical protein
MTGAPAQRTSSTSWMSASLQKASTPLVVGAGLQRRVTTATTLTLAQQLDSRERSLFRWSAV